MTRRLAQTAFAALAVAGLILAALALGGCIEAPEGPEPMCETSDQCGAGETCDEGICWGNPPAGPFAAVLTPPAERTDLVQTEFPVLSIDADGNIADLVFAETITVSGRVVIDCPDQIEPTDCNPDLSVAAQIWVRRPSDIQGAPDYKRSVDAVAGAGPGDDAFTLLLPRLPAGAEPYEITVLPGAAIDNETLAPAAMAPPVRFTLAGDQDEVGADWVLGSPEDHTWVMGRITDAASRGIADMQVTLLGRWTEGGVAERSSTVGTTDAEGSFVLRVPLAMLDVYELVARPASGQNIPTLYKAELLIEDPPSGDQWVDIGDVRMPSYPAPTSFVLPLLGTSSGGAEVAVAGAEVEVTTALSGDLGVTALFTANGSSDTDGKVALQLIPGGNFDRPYLVQVRTAPDSEHASIAGHGIAVGPSTGYLSGLLLPRRIGVSGKLWDDDLQPVTGAQVVAEPSVAFAWRLALDIQDFLDNLQAPSTTTDDHGAFLLWVDPLVAEETAVYDLQITPQPGTAAPPWTEEGQEVMVTGEEPITGRQLGDIRLPAASYARGTVKTAGGEEIEGATLWVLQIRTDDMVCNGAIRPLGDVCVPPAIPRGVWSSRSDGQVWIALPDPE